MGSRLNPICMNYGSCRKCDSANDIRSSDCFFSCWACFCAVSYIFSTLLSIGQSSAPYADLQGNDMETYNAGYSTVNGSEILILLFIYWEQYLVKRLY